MSQSAPDARLEFVLSEATRQLERQEATVDNVRTRAGTILGTGALAASFLGAATYGKSGLSGVATVAVIVAVIALLVVLAGVLTVLWPWDFTWYMRPSKVLRDYVDATPKLSLDEMRRQLAERMEEARDSNTATVNRLMTALRIASAAVVVEVLAWIFALGMR